MGFLYVAATILLTVYGQIVIKWQVSQAGALPAAVMDKAWFLGKLLFNPWVFSGFLAAFLAAVSWMAAMTKFPLNVAYPFMSLAFVGTLVMSSLVLGEALNPAKWAGMGLLVLGLAVGAQKW